MSPSPSKSRITAPGGRSVAIGSGIMIMEPTKSVNYSGLLAEKGKIIISTIWRMQSWLEIVGTKARIPYICKGSKSCTYTKRYMPPSDAWNSCWFGGLSWACTFFVCTWFTTLTNRSCVHFLPRQLGRSRCGVFYLCDRSRVFYDGDEFGGLCGEWAVAADSFVWI